MGRDTAGLLRKTRTEEKQRKRKKGRGKREGARRAFGGKKRGRTEKIAGRGGHHLELGKRSFSKTLLHHLPIYTHCFVVCLG